MFRQDRGSHKKGGGLLVYVKNIYMAWAIEKWSSVTESNFQKLWLKVLCKKLIVRSIGKSGFRFSKSNPDFPIEREIRK